MKHRFIVIVTMWVRAASMREANKNKEFGFSSQSVKQSGARPPDRSYSPAVERFVPNHVVEDPLAFPLDPLFGDPGGGHQHDRQEAPAN